jgi:hypothetical protein
MRIVLVGFLSDEHGRSCKSHPYGCGNALLESTGNGVGTMVRLRLVKEKNLAGHLLREDGTDGCRVCFTAREYAIGPNACRLDSALVRSRRCIFPTR